MGRPSRPSGTIEERFQRDNKRRKKLFTKRLVQARQAAKLTQRELASLLHCSQSLVARVERGGDVDFLLFERWASILLGSLQQFATLDPEINKRPFWDHTTHYYLGHTLADWQHYLKFHGWPVIPGFYTFVANHYRLTRRSYSGWAIEAFQLHKQNMLEVDIPSPS